MATPIPRPSVKPTPKPTKKGITVAISKGVTMDLKTGVRTTKTPTPKPFATISTQEYLRRQKEFLAQQKKANKK